MQGLVCPLKKPIIDTVLKYIWKCRQLLKLAQRKLHFNLHTAAVEMLSQNCPLLPWWSLTGVYGKNPLAWVSQKLPFWFILHPAWLKFCIRVCKTRARSAAWRSHLHSQTPNLLVSSSAAHSGSIPDTHPPSCTPALKGPQTPRDLLWAGSEACLNLNSMQGLAWPVTLPTSRVPRQLWFSSHYPFPNWWEVMLLSFPSVSIVHQPLQWKNQTHLAFGVMLLFPALLWWLASQIPQTQRSAVLSAAIGCP